jgi:TRAP-type uncharacterized transport system fused permease subunit
MGITTPAYVIMTALLVPAIVSSGGGAGRAYVLLCHPVGDHPPVALAVYAAAG